MLTIYITNISEVIKFVSKSASLGVHSRPKTEAVDGSSLYLIFSQQLLIKKKKIIKMSNTRRKFVKTIAGSTFVASAVAKGVFSTQQKITLPYQADFSGIDEMRIGAIGMGIMGFNNTRTALSIPGVNLIAACDLYEGRLTRTKEVHGQDVETTRNYQEILNRQDIDAVIISTSDHWHDKITIEALKAGKHVYVEKPMVHHIAEGKAVIEAEKKYGKVVQVGSQRVSSLIYKKAKEIYESGVLGRLLVAEASFNRQSALGAWQYSIPTDASPETISWDKYIGDAPQREFDKNHFFRWRNYQAYGTGVAGDLFVHLFSGMHVILSSLGPNKIYATGGLRHWEDGRDVPDVMLALFDYPETEQHEAFNMVLKVNFVDGGGGGGEFKLVGSEGVLEVKGNELILSQSKMSDAPGYGGWDSFGTFSEAQQKEFKVWYDSQFPDPKKRMTKKEEIIYKQPRDFSADKAHFMNFFNAVLGKEKAIEDASFGLRAAAPSLAANMSYFERRPIFWDPGRMVLKE